MLFCGRSFALYPWGAYSTPYTPLLDLEPFGGGEERENGNKCHYSKDLLRL